MRVQELDAPGGLDKGVKLGSKVVACLAAFARAVPDTAVELAVSTRTLSLTPTVACCLTVHCVTMPLCRRWPFRGPKTLTSSPGPPGGSQFHGSPGP